MRARAFYERFRFVVCDPFAIETVPGAKGQKHTIIKGGGHFLQDDVGEELAQVIVEFMQDNPV